jgi:peptide/histidine transporter 3/4
MACLDKAAIRGATHGKSGAAAAGGTAISVSTVEESKAFYRIMPIFALVIIYQMTYDPIFTLLPYPGDVMDRRLGSKGLQIPASSISFANTFGVLATIPLYDMVLVPLLARSKRPITVTQRIGGGFFIQILALLSAGAVETARYRQSAGVRALFESDGGGPEATEASPDPLDPKYTQPMSIWVQFGPYYILGAAEVFTNIGVIELFYVGVSSGMKSIGSAVYLFSTAW